MITQVRIAGGSMERFIFLIISDDFTAGSADDPTCPRMIRFLKDHDVRTVVMVRSGSENLPRESFVRTRLFSRGFIVRQVRAPGPAASAYGQYASLCLSLYRDLDSGSVLMLSVDAFAAEAVFVSFLVSVGQSPERALSYLEEEPLPALKNFLAVYASFLPAEKPRGPVRKKKPRPGITCASLLEEHVPPDVEVPPGQEIESAVEIREEKKVIPDGFLKEEIPSIARGAPGSGIRMSIRFKLVGIVSAVILFSLTVMIFLATFFFKRDNEVRIQENGLKVSEVLARNVQDDLAAIIEKSSILARLGPGGADVIREVLLDNERNIAAVSVMTRQGAASKGTIVYTLFNDGMQDEKRYTRGDILNAISASEGSLSRAFDGDNPVVNVSSLVNAPVMLLAAPFEKRGDGFYSVLIVTCRLDEWLKTFGARGIMVSFLVNGEGEVLVHPDLRLVMTAENYSTLPVVRQMMKSVMDNGHTLYYDRDGVRCFGSFKKIGFGSMGVISTVEEKKALEEVFNIQRRNIYIMIIMLNISIVVVVFFARTLTDPIYRLLRATRDIQEGKFNVSISVTSNDELSDLSYSFMKMGEGLAEREKIKDAFGKFVNRDLAEMVLHDEVSLGGQRKDAVIMFTDIRSFTAMSERFQPEVVVEFLNKYFTEMVNCVYSTGGIVDKYIGDSIMAVWGTPVSRGNDIENAVNAALMMREKLVRFNHDRGGPDRPLINMGCGINAGPVIAGQIGSNDRMEYTVIGDTVNLASRIEALNKPFGTDIIISDNAYQAVRDIFDVRRMKRTRVKGKVKVQVVYAVLGRFDDPSRPLTIDELRKRLKMSGAGYESDGDSDGELKYEILDG